MDDSEYYRRYFPPSYPTPSHTAPISDGEDSFSAGRLWETCTNFGFVFTIFVIIVLQFKDPLVRWYRTTVFRLRYMSAGEWIVEQWWTSLDYVRGIWFMGLEILRNSGDLLMPVNETGDSPPRPRRLQLRRRINPHRNTPLPELLEDDNDKLNDGRIDEVGVGEAEEVNGSGNIRQWNQRELEPAFLKDSDYPAGWMVFHPVLGVVSKEEADMYNCESERRGTPEVEEENGAPAPVHQLMRSHLTPSKNTNAAEPCVLDKECANENALDRSQPPLPAERASGIPDLRSIAAGG